MTKEESKEDPSDLIYDLPKGYDIWNGELPKNQKLLNIHKRGGDTSNPNQTTQRIGYKWF